MDAEPRNTDIGYDYDVALSFAGEQRPYVEEVARVCRNNGIRVFYDDYEQVALWGKNLYEHLRYVYAKAARYCVLFVSREYADKVWTSHERRSAQERALVSKDEYVLPVRFDDTEVPGLASTVMYVNARNTPPAELGKLIAAKVGPLNRKNYLPPTLDRLFRRLGDPASPERDYVTWIAESFLDVLVRMSLDERRLVFYCFIESCPSGGPDDPHVNLDLLRRELGMAPTEAVATARGMRSLGFMASVEAHGDSEDAQDVLHLRWQDMSAHGGNVDVMEFADENSTTIAFMMINESVEHACPDCIERIVRNLDFSGLAD